MPVNFAAERGLATITIDNPPVNALDRAQQADLMEAAITADRETDVRTVLIQGAGGNFCAGADIREMSAMTHADMEVHAPNLHAAFRAVGRIGKPTAVAVEGFALGGGLELALAADYCAAAESAVLGLPEILLGVIPGAGGTQRLARVIGAKAAKQMIFTGETIPATEAANLGLVDIVTPDGRAADAAREWLARFAAGPALALRAAKAAIDEGLGSGFDLETRQFAALFGTADRTEGMTAFLQRRPPRFGID